MNATWSEPLSVALVPLKAPRLDGVIASTGNGPRAVTLPAVSYTRTVRRRAPAGIEAARMTLRVRVGHGAGLRYLRAESAAPTTPATESTSSTRRIPVASEAVTVTGSEPSRWPPATR